MPKRPLRHWIVAVRSPRMTFFEAVPSKFEALLETIATECRQSILRTTWRETAARWKQGRDGQLVKPYEQDCDLAGQTLLIFDFFTHI